MNLHEFQSKKLFAGYGIPVPFGYAVETAKEARAAFLEFALGPEATWPANFRDFAAAFTRMASSAACWGVDS